MSQAIPSKHYKINSSPLHGRKNPLNYQYIPTQKVKSGYNDPFQNNNMASLLNPNQLLSRKVPSFNLSKSQENLTKNIKKTDFSSNIKLQSKQGQFSNSIDSFKEPKITSQYGFQMRKPSPQMHLKLPQIATPEESKNRFKSNSSILRRTSREKKEFENNKDHIEKLPQDLKKQKRLSDAGGSVGFIIPEQNDENKKVLLKPHNNTYNDNVFLYFTYNIF